MRSPGSDATARRIALLATAALAICAGAASAADVAAVLSSYLRPYQEASEGLKAAASQPIEVISLNEGRTRLPSETKFVVTFGAKAALEPYPERVTLITCLSPGLNAAASGFDRRTVHISMDAAPNALLAKLKEIQPALRTLAVFWSGNGSQDEVEQVQAAAAPFSIAVKVYRLESSDQLPETLRNLKNKADALWLPADPMLINPRSFETIKRYSLSNALPLYVPTEGLLSQGATASVSVDFREIGRAAALAVQQIQGGQTPPRDVYPQQVRIGLNLKSAREVGLTLSETVIGKADMVIR